MYFNSKSKLGFGLLELLLLMGVVMMIVISSFTLSQGKHQNSHSEVVSVSQNPASQPPIPLTQKGKPTKTRKQPQEAPDPKKEVLAQTLISRTIKSSETKEKLLTKSGMVVQTSWNTWNGIIRAIPDSTGRFTTLHATEVPRGACIVTLSRVKTLFPRISINQTPVRGANHNEVSMKQVVELCSRAKDQNLLELGFEGDNVAAALEQLTPVRRTLDSTIHPSKNSKDTSGFQSNGSF